MPRIGRSFPAPLRRTRGPLSSLNFVPRISPHPGYRPRQQLARDRMPSAWVFPAPPGPAPGLPTLVAEAAWTTDPLATPTWAPLPRCRALKVAGNHRSAALGRFDAGVITATFSNKDRSLEPLYAAGANYPNVKQRKRIRVRAAAHAGTGTTYPIAHGYIEKIPPTYPKDWKDAVAGVTASDAFRLFAGIPLQNPYVMTVLADNPTAYYRFLETSGLTAADSSGYTRNGTYSGGITFSQIDPITDGSDHAILLDGTAQVLPPPGVSLPASLSQAIEFWMRTSAFPLTGLLMWIIGAEAGAPIFAVNGAGKLFVTGPSITSATTVNDGTWHHIAYDRATGQLYVDKLPEGAPSTAGSSGAVRIGQMPAVYSTAYQGYVGSLAEVAIYTTSNLSAARVAAHFDARNAWINDTSDARIIHILDAIGWPGADRDLDAGVAVLTDAADLNGTTKLLDHFRNVDATEGGCLTMSRDGKVMMRNRHSIQTGPARNTVSQATFGDQGGTEIGWTDLGMAFDDVELANRVEISRRNGVLSVALDQAQITAYGTVQVLARNNIASTDIDAAAQAQWLLALLENPNRWRFEKVIVPLTDTNQDAVLGREIWDRVTVAFTPPGGGARIIQDVLIVGIDHDVTKPGQWVVTFHTTGTDLQLSPFILDTSLLDGSGVMVF